MATHIQHEDTVRFQIDPLPDESTRACAAITKVLLPPSRAELIVLGIYGAVAVAGYLLTPATRLATIVIGIGAVMATLTLLRAESRWRLRRLRAADPHALETHYIELSPEGVRAWCAHVDARYPWSDFVKVAETPEFYVFARGSGAGSAIPKRLLEESSDAALRARIREWAPDRGAGLAREVS